MDDLEDEKWYENMKNRGWPWVGPGWDGDRGGLGKDLFIYLQLGTGGGISETIASLKTFVIILGPLINAAEVGVNLVQLYNCTTVSVIRKNINTKYWRIDQ